MASVLSATRASDAAFVASESRFPSRLSAIAVRRVSRPSIALAIPPTASAGGPSGVRPRIFTARRTDSSVSRFVRTLAIVSAADDTPSTVRSIVPVKLSAAAEAFSRATAVRSRVVARPSTLVSTRSLTAPIRPLTQTRAPRPRPATSRPTSP